LKRWASSLYNLTMEAYETKEAYVAGLRGRAALPEGFKAAKTALEFYPAERDAAQPLKMNLSLILLDEATPVFSGVFTRNQFPGTPVLIGRKRLSEPRIRGILINNKIANVCVQTGEEDALSVLQGLSGLVGSPVNELIPCSTGIIGFRLPIGDMKKALPALVSSLQGDSIMPAAEGIMTTDAFPKVRSSAVGSGRIVAIAKGAGMIEPNMATMLCFILTDIDMTREAAERALRRAVSVSLNRISVDSDQSTSDTALILSSRRKPPVSEEEFTQALISVLGPLSCDIVRNGEGTAHVMKVMVEGAPDEARAAGFAKAVVNSPLVKTAVFGNDPNVGRIICALGDYAGNNGLSIDRSRVSIALGPDVVFSEGAFTLDTEKEKRLYEYLKNASLPSGKGFPVHDRTVDIRVSLGMGTEKCTVHGSDLSYDYVKENADYRT
jgi:glutamate N-acetyltransferase/amino-acid N-acetyltransferase